MKYKIYEAQHKLHDHASISTGQPRELRAARVPSHSSYTDADTDSSSTSDHENDIDGHCRSVLRSLQKSNGHGKPLKYEISTDYNTDAYDSGDSCESQSRERGITEPTDLPRVPRKELTRESKIYHEEVTPRPRVSSKERATIQPYDPENSRGNVYFVIVVVIWICFIAAALKFSTSWILSLIGMGFGWLFWPEDDRFGLEDFYKEENID